jgi:hypothetical protein
LYRFLDEREYQVIADIKNEYEMLETGHSNVDKPNSKETCVATRNNIRASKQYNFIR